MVEILVPLGLFAAVFGAFYVFISARNKERMALIESGADPKIFRPDPRFKMFNTLRNALLLIGIGVGLFISMIFMEYTALNDEGIAFGLVLLFGGAGLLIAFLLRKKVISPEEQND